MWIIATFIAVTSDDISLILSLGGSLSSSLLTMTLPGASYLIHV